MIVVLTTPGRDYLTDTIKSIDSSSQCNNKIVLCDYADKGFKEIPIPTGWKLEQFHRITSHKQNKFVFWRAFELAVEAKENLVFYEDDIKLCRGGGVFIDQFQVPKDVAWVTFYSPWGGRYMVEALWRLGAASFAFCQALKFPLSTCETLVSMKQDMLNSRMGGSDELLAELGKKLGWHFGIFYPAIVQHVGVTSEVGNGNLVGSRVAEGYKGDLYNIGCIRMNHYNMG